MDSNDTLGALPPSLGSQHKGFQAVSFGAVPVSVVPGNHDANPNGTSSNFETQIEQFRSTYGADYSSFTTRFATVVMVDSEALIWEEQGGAREPPNAQMRNESETQWTWIDKTLAKAEADTQRPHTLVVTHHPPFLTSPDEPVAYWNWPPKSRARFLALLGKYSVKMVMAGHTHTTTEVKTGNLLVMTTAGTARTFDGKGCGHRIVTLNATSVTQAYVPQNDSSLIHCVGNSF